MVFIKKEMNDFERVLYYCTYKPYRIFGELNPNFDRISGLILDVKEGKDSGIDYFYSILNDLLMPEIAIVTVPSHDPDNKTNGIRKLAQRLAQMKNRIDATSCLVRYKKIQKLAHGGNRDFQVHLESILVQDLHLVRGRNVLLLDDVTTTGNSLLACKHLLIQHGVMNVQCYALGKTEGWESA